MPFSHLSKRISPEELANFVELARQVGEVIAEIKKENPAVTRDPKDHYLLAYAVVGDADHLVTGDMNLLLLESVSSLKMIKPADFVALLGNE